MTKIKLCGLSRPCDIQTANELMPEYIGFVFAPKSKRYIDPQQAAQLKELLSPDIRAVGVFVDEAPDTVAALLNSGVIDIAQLHGGEDEAYIQRLRQLADKPIIKAFQIKSRHDLNEAEACFLAGGLSPDNVGDAVRLLHPYAVDISSGIETDGRKDEEKAAAFIAAVRKEKQS